MVTSQSTRVFVLRVAALVVSMIIIGSASSHVVAQSVANNPYHAVHGWEKMPNGWKLGVPSGIFPDPDGEHMCLGVDFQGNIYAGEVGRQRLVKYVRFRP